MTLQHYLPATYLAIFSFDNSGSRRERRLYVGISDENKIFVEKTGNICGVNNIYKSSMVEGFDIDNSWNYYEAELDLAIDLLLNQNISALAWLKVLVPFVTGLLIRGPDFSERFEDRIIKIGASNVNTDINLARMFEFQRLLTIVATAKWVVIETEGITDLITNDLGYAPYGNPIRMERGMAIPIGKKNVLFIVPQIYRWIAYYSKDEWKPYIEYAYLTIGDTNSFNRMLGKYSQRFIFGSCEKLIMDNLAKSYEKIKPLEPAELGFPGQFGINHEMTWYRMVDIFTRKNFKNYTHFFMDLRLKPESDNMIISPLLYESIYH